MELEQGRKAVLGMLCTVSFVFRAVKSLMMTSVPVNSVDKDDDGNYLVSSRHYHQVYKIDGSSGDILWRLGGKDNDFTMNNGTNVSF